MRRLSFAFVAALALAGCGNAYTNTRSGASGPDDLQRAHLHAQTQTVAHREPVVPAADGEPQGLKTSLNQIVGEVHRRLALGGHRGDVLAYVDAQLDTLIPEYDALVDTRVQEGFISRLDDELHAVGLRRIGPSDGLFPY